jgi:hypothetical protein
MIDLSKTITSLKTHTVEVLRLQPQAIVDGRTRENPAVSAGTFDAVVQPTGGSELLQAPEGAHARDLFTVFLLESPISPGDFIAVPSLGNLQVYGFGDRKAFHGNYIKAMCRLVRDARESLTVGSVP